MRAKTLDTSRAADIKAELMKTVGDIGDWQVMSDLVLVATYIEPETTPGGIIKPNKTLDESRFQGKAGLILKLGQIAFKYDGSYPYEGPSPKVGDWVIYRSSDTSEVFIRGVSCRWINSDLIRAIVSDPSIIY